MKDHNDRDNAITIFNKYLHAGTESMFLILNRQENDQEFMLNFVWPSIIHIRSLNACHNIDLTNLNNFCSNIAQEQQSIINHLHNSFSEICSSITSNSNHSVSVINCLSTLENNIQKKVLSLIDNNLNA